MIKIACFLFVIVFSLIAPSAKTQNIQLSKKVKAVLNSVEKERIRKDIAYLADDKLKGRMPGEPGFQLAANYVADQYKQIGLLPAGDNGTYFQKLVLRKSTLDQHLSAAVLKDRLGNEDSLTTGKDIFIIPDALKTEKQVSGSMVFVGYGIDIPGKYSDYTGIDVKGKIVVFLNGAPAGLELPSTLVAHFANAASKIGIAAGKGAIGAIIAPSDTAAIRGNPGAITVAMNSAKTDAYGRSVAANNIMAARVTFAILNRFFINSGRSLKQTIGELKKGKPASFDLQLSINLWGYNTNKDIESYNVAGMIEGGDKDLKSEFVIHTAHLDHLGVGKTVNGDSIYNGAHDNASGVASLLEIARTYQQIGSKPRRSVLIVMVTAEEMGTLGSAYFAANPTVPKSKIVADVNTDMPTLIAPLLSVAPLGAEHSSLTKNVAFACNQLGIEMQADPMPEENRFIRSDQYSFVLQGIPALHVKYGNKTNDPNFDLVKFTKDWRDANYHKPSDEITNNLDLDAAKKYVQLNFLISYSIAQTTERPTWNPGDFFGVSNSN